MGLGCRCRLVGLLQAGTDLRAARVASCFLGANPPTLFLAAGLVRAMLSE